MKVPDKIDRQPVETALPEGRVQIASRRVRCTVLIEPGARDPRRGPLLRVSGHPHAMNQALKTRFSGRWDPVTRTWTIPAFNALALRAYLQQAL